MLQNQHIITGFITSHPKKVNGLFPLPFGTIGLMFPISGSCRLFAAGTRKNYSRLSKGLSIFGAHFRSCSQHILFAHYVKKKKIESCFHLILIYCIINAIGLHVRLVNLNNNKTHTNKNTQV